MNEIALGHAWDWFALHSKHRFQLLNFWLLAEGILTNGLVLALTRSAWGVALVVALAGAGAAFGFHWLDRRTRQQIQAGEAALRLCQREMARETGIPELEILDAVHRPDRLGSFRVIIGTIHWTTAVLFLAVAVYAAARGVIT